MNNIALGRYVAYDTVIHRLDPRVKLVSLVALLVCIFARLVWWNYLFLGVVLAILLILSKIKFVTIIKSLKPMWFMMLVVLIFNIFLVKTGDVLVTVFGYDIYTNSLLQTASIFIRLLYMIEITTILTTTTKTLDLTYALEFYMSPLKVIKFPAHEIAMTISIALRFIPTLLEETDKIMKAQASRGVDIKSGKFSSKINGIVSLIIPLFVSSFERSEELANAMEARGYNPSGSRTRYRTFSFKLRDVIAFIVTALIVAITFVIVGLLG